MTQQASADKYTKSRDSKRTRAKILQAALEEFAARGFGAATVRDIAGRANISHGMVRHHYETKEKLWFAAVDFLFARLNAEVGLKPEEHTRLEKGDLNILRIWLRKYVRYCAQHPEHARMMMQESVAPSDRLDKALRKHVRGSHMAIVSFVERLQKRNILSFKGPAESLIYIVSGACQNLFALAPEARCTLNYDALSETAIEAHADAIVSIFCPETQAGF